MMFCTKSAIIAPIGGHIRNCGLRREEKNVAELLAHPLKKNAELIRAILNSRISGLGAG